MTRKDWKKRHQKALGGVSPRETSSGIPLAPVYVPEDVRRASFEARIPVAERTWSREALEAEDPATSLRLHARNSRRICERVADLLWAVESAAAAG